MPSQIYRSLGILWSCHQSHHYINHSGRSRRNWRWKGPINFLSFSPENATWRSLYEVDSHELHKLWDYSSYRQGALPWGYSFLQVGEPGVFSLINAAITFCEGPCMGSLVGMTILFAERDHEKCPTRRTKKVEQTFPWFAATQHPFLQEHMVHFGKLPSCG